MLNHFARKKLGFSKKLPPSPAYNLIFDTLPKDKLITKDTLVIAVLQRDSSEARTSGEKNIFINAKAVSDMLDEMVKQGFVKEIPGVQLEKIVDN
jgi:hypothetical protein